MGGGGVADAGGAVEAAGVAVVAAGALVVAGGTEVVAAGIAVVAGGGVVGEGVVAGKMGFWEAGGGVTMTAGGGNSSGSGLLWKIPFTTLMASCREEPENESEAAVAGLAAGAGASHRSLGG